jgi:hypothetical protein
MTVFAGLPAASLSVTRLSSAVLEGVLQPAGDDAVDHADVDDIGQVVARRGLAGRQADRAGVAADHGRDAGRVHLLHLGIAAFRRRLRVAEHRLDLRAAQRLDPAGGVDLLDRHDRADPALLAGIGERAGDRMQHADLHGGALRAQHGRRAEQSGRRRGGAQRRRLQQPPAAHGQQLTRHPLSP